MRSGNGFKRKARKTKYAEIESWKYKRSTSGDFSEFQTAQEDVKLYGQLPDYDCQGYDMGQEDILRQIDLGIYSNFHRPSWQTLKHHFLMIKIPKNIY